MSNCCSRFRTGYPPIALRRAHANIDDNGSGGNWGYRASKTAVNMVGTNLMHEFRPRGIAVALLHPGFVATSIGVKHGLTTELVWRLLTLFAISVEQGARTLVHAATAPEAATLSGTYLVGCKPRASSTNSYDTRAANQLWQASEELTTITA